MASRRSSHRARRVGTWPSSLLFVDHARDWSPQPSERTLVLRRYRGLGEAENRRSGLACRRLGNGRATDLESAHMFHLPATSSSSGVAAYPSASRIPGRNAGPNARWSPDIGRARVQPSSPSGRVNSGDRRCTNGRRARLCRLRASGTETWGHGGDGAARLSPLRPPPYAMSVPATDPPVPGFSRRRHGTVSARFIGEGAAAMEQWSSSSG